MFTMYEWEIIRDTIDLEMKHLGPGCERYQILKDIKRKVKENIIKAGV